MSAQRPFGQVGTIIDRLNKMIFGWGGNLTRLFAIPLNEIDYEKEIGDPTNSDVVMAPVQWMMRTFPEAPLGMRRFPINDEGEREEELILDHPLLDIIDDPNPFYPLETLWSSTVLSYAIDGNAYWMKIYTKAGKLIQLWWVPHTLMYPVSPWELEEDEEDFINYYRYTIPGVGEYFVPPESVVHFRFGQDLENPRMGLSPIKSAFREMFSDKEASSWTAALLKNGAVPGLIAAPDINPLNPGVRVSDEGLKSVKEYLTAAFTGAQDVESLTFQAYR